MPLIGMLPCAQVLPFPFLWPWHFLLRIMWLLLPYAGHFANGSRRTLLGTVPCCCTSMYSQRQLHSGVRLMATAEPFTLLAWHSPQLTTSLSVPSGWERQ